MDRQSTLINSLCKVRDIYTECGLYQMIRVAKAPKEIDIHFVESDIDPTDLGEPTFPSVFGTLANALYKATMKRFCDQPFTVT
jgi:CO/xanthine dehydrogenase Mo-binding subunit